MSFETPEAVAIELITYTENDGDIYRRQTEPILRNLATKKARGDYDSERAVQAFMYLAETGAKEYARALGGEGSSPWHAMFPIDIRRMAAKHWRDEFETEYALGNYNNLLPKKYQPKPPKASGKTGYHAHNVGDEVWWWGSQGGKIVGTVRRVLMPRSSDERPDYEVQIHGAGSLDMKMESELASETGRKRLARQTRAHDRNKAKK